MSVHVCKTCGLKFEYCRACVFRPIRYKDLGFCSKKCYEASKNKIEEVVPAEDVEVVVIEEGTSTPTEKAIEYPYFFTATEEEIIEEPDEKFETETIEDVEENFEEDFEEEIEEEETETDDYFENYGEELRAE